MFFRPHSRLNSLASISSYSSSNSSSSASSSASSFDNSFDPSLASPASSSYGPESRGALLTSTFLPEDLLLKNSSTPRFSRPAVPFAINLRNFRLQATKLASVSDIVIYSADGLASPDLLPTAERFLAAQKEMRAGRLAESDNAEDLVEYRVFVVEDRFEVFEQFYPDLVAVDQNGFVRNKIDFFNQEKEEMRVLTEASQIADGVWLGNTQDVPLSRPLARTAARMDSSDDLGVLVAALETDTLTYNSLPLPKRSHQISTSDSSSSFERDEMEDGNPHGYSICIEAHDKALMASTEALRGYENMVDRIHRNVKPGQNVEPEQITHLECLSTGDACTTQSSLINFMENVIQLVVWIRRQTKRPVEPVPASPTSIFSRGRKPKSSLSQDEAKWSPRNVLIHTADGYTDTSVLALAYVMYDSNLTLPQAYLHLQHEAQRSFFVYPNDVELLGQLECRLLALVHQEKRGTKIDAVIETSPSAPGLGLFRPRLNRANSPNTPALSRQGSYQQSSMADKMIAAPWFYNERFDGHFPSRILPFLYLGNLNHATNALMLKELGITHVVSIGESALIPPRDGHHESSIATGFGNVPTKIKGCLPTNSLWLEQRMGNIEVLDLQGISDDGIDPIKGLFERSNDFIEDARRKGGKVLVHCRVGVSRSSSLVIAYVMKHCEVDLQSAYLLTRSRRLNILIQPTVLFMWSLQWYEAELERRRIEAGKPPIGGKLTWGYLAREMSELNYRYLGC